MKLFARNTASAVLTYNFVLMFFLLKLALFFPSFFAAWLNVALFVVTVMTYTLTVVLAYHVRIYPLWLPLICIGLCVPYHLGLVTFLLVFWRAGSYLKEEGYALGLTGARPAREPDDVTGEIDRLIREGKIRKEAGSGE